MHRALVFLRRRSRVLTNIGNAINYSDPSKQKALILVGIVGLPNRARIDIIDGIPCGIGARSRHKKERVISKLQNLQPGPR